MKQTPNPQAQHQKDSSQQAIVAEWARKQRVLEINPKSPLIQGMLSKIALLNDVQEGEEKDADLEQEMREVNNHQERKKKSLASASSPPYSES